jgi:putative heme-binding domain-containing protein
MRRCTFERPWLTIFSRAFACLACAVTSKIAMLSIAILGPGIARGAEEGQGDLPAVQVFVPGFEVRPLPIRLTNAIHIEYARDGRLFVSGYDGRVHMLRDRDGDGLEEEVTTIRSESTDDYALGMVVRDDGLYLLLKNQLIRYRDGDGDGVPETREVVLEGWDDPAMDQHPLINHRRFDYAMGLAIDEDGWIYIGMGNAAYHNPYIIDAEAKISDKGTAHYDPNNLRGCILRFSPDGKEKTRLVTGVRYVMCMRVNGLGDLFATDQEGATWLPNGNPFDELLHLQEGRHYGFPPRHPKYLPDAVDEPSVFDYQPQHQSLCGMRFNGMPGWPVFGPESWRGDALVAGFTRGKIYRTKLVKTEHGYVAQNQLIIGMQSMAVDLTFSPTGALVVASHSGQPDWGTGPEGPGSFYKITYQGDPNVAIPVAAWHPSPSELRVAWDRPVEPTKWKSIGSDVQVQSGPFVAAGDRFETLRPGYEVVQRQVQSPKVNHPLDALRFAQDGRTTSIAIAPDASRTFYGLRLGAFSEPTANGTSTTTSTRIAQQPAIDLATDACGVTAVWQSDQPEATPVTTWLPHLDLTISAALTKGSAEHDAFFDLLQQPGILRLTTQLDLSHLLQPAIQPGSELDHPLVDESIQLRLESNHNLRGRFDDSAQQDGTSVRQRVTIAPSQAPTRIELTIATDAIAPTLTVDWSHGWDEAKRRAFPLRRFLMPWVQIDASASPPIAPSIPAELAGGDWKKGREIFVGTQTNCSKCHVIRGEGNKRAPDLSNLIHRDVASVLRDIHQPSAAINPEYLTYHVLTSDGTITTGVIQTNNDEWIELLNASGEVVRIDKSLVEEITPSATSIMPTDLLKPLGDDQIRDLLVFLLTTEP